MTDTTSWQAGHIPDPRDTSFTTDLEKKYPPLTQATANLVVEAQAKRIAELEANCDALCAEVRVYGAANGELKDVLFDAQEAFTSAEKVVLEQQAEVAKWRKLLAQLDRRRLEQVERAEKAEAALEKKTSACELLSELHGIEFGRADGAEAALAALKARRCETCKDSSQTEHGDFCCEIGLEMVDYEPFPDGFCCSEWEARP